MGKRLSGIMILTIFSLIIVNTLALAVPMTINYQGKLTDPNGSVLNGEYQMSFSLFNTDTNGTALWSEQQTVTLINGIYNVQLGAVNPLSASIFDNDALFLEVGIESETLLPRHKLASVAFAIRAQEAETVGGIPVEDLVTETEFDTKITTQVFTDDQIPDDISINYSAIAGDADTLDGKDSTKFGDGHSLDAADGDPVDAVYVDNEGNVGIGMMMPKVKLEVSGAIKIGSSEICDAGTEGSIRYNFTNKKMEFCNGSKWNEMISFGPPAHLTETQSIPTNGAIDWESFTIGADTYLAVANHYNDSTRNINSKIYRWIDSNFVEAQSIPTNGAHDWESFIIGADTYLAVANYHNDSTYNINSKIYKWNGSYFVEAQSIPTNGAYDWESFTIGADTYLAVANFQNDYTRNINSKIYQWNGSYFVEVQSIPTNGAIDWESFIIGADTYLAVANLHNHNGSTYNINSKIYK